MPECPTCGDSCDTGCGVKLHHYYKHNKSIATETSNCLSCDAEFEYYPSEKKGKYCPDCVDDIPWDWSYEDPGGSDSPHWSREIRSCSNCGDDVAVKQSKLDNEHHFCDFSCVTQYRRENWQGENHPLWSGGEIESYGKGWVKTRRRARERDSYKCRVCNKSREEIGYGPEVHHIKPVREYGDVEDAHHLDNVISLCPTCHANAEHDNISRDELYRKI